MPYSYGKAPILPLNKENSSGLGSKATVLAGGSVQKRSFLSLSSVQRQIKYLRLPKPPAKTKVVLAGFWHLSPPPAPPRFLSQFLRHATPAIPVSFSLISCALCCVCSCSFRRQLFTQLWRFFWVCGVCCAHSVRVPLTQVFR